MFWILSFFFMKRGLVFRLDGRKGYLDRVRRFTGVVSLRKGRRYLLVPPSGVTPEIWVTGEFVDAVGQDLRFTGLNGYPDTILRLRIDSDGLYRFGSAELLQSQKFIETAH